MPFAPTCPNPRVDSATVRSAHSTIIQMADRFCAETTHEPAHNINKSGVDELLFDHFELPP